MFKEFILISIFSAVIISVIIWFIFRQHYNLSIIFLTIGCVFMWQAHLTITYDRCKADQNQNEIENKQYSKNHLQWLNKVFNIFVRCGVPFDPEFIIDIRLREICIESALPENKHKSEDFELETKLLIAIKGVYNEEDDRKAQIQAQIIDTHRNLEIFKGHPLMEACLVSKLEDLKSELETLNGLELLAEKINRCENGLRDLSQYNHGVWSGDSKQEFVRKDMPFIDFRPPEEKPKLGEWISVFDNPPKDNEDVLLKDDNGNRFVGSIFESIGLGYFCISNKNRELEMSSITHWMPLPE